MLDRKMGRDLKQLATQTVTVAILVACGVSLMISAWSAYRSLTNARDTYYSEYRFGDFFAEFKHAPNDIASKIRKIIGINTLETRIIIDGIVDIPKQIEPAVGRFISIPTGVGAQLNKIYLRTGRLPVDAETTEVLVHEGFALANNLRVGDRISVLIQGRQESLQIAGVGLSPEFVYALSPSAPLPDDRHFGVFWVPFRGLERLAGMPNGFNSVTGILEPDATFESVKADLDQILKPYGNRGAYNRKNQSSNMFVEDEIAEQKVFAYFLPSIFLGIAAFLIHIISSRLITIHRPQIATLKAIGYTNHEVSIHYLKLVTVMMLFGAIPGVGVGALLGRLMAKAYQGFFRFPSLDFSVSGEAAFLGIVAGVVPGMFGATAAIRTAFRLAPAEAMRPPAPPVFRATRLENWGSLQRFGVAGKMVFRNLLRRPGRLLATIIGISFALAIVVSSGFWMDTLDYMITTQFQRIQREDMSVSLLNPVSRGGIREIEDLPGVQKAEGYRSVPVRIHYLNFKKETLLTGWPENAELRKRIDRDLKEIELPSYGLSLSRYFERNWGVRAGDWVEIETLEGELKKTTLRVAGFADDFVGVSLNMRIEDLWRTLDEEPSYNFVTIKSDPRSLSSLYVKLKELPIAVGVAMKNSVYRGFQQTMAELIRTSTSILMAFALAISVAVTYNSVRVNFSERAWEMATLRVIGFKRSYVFGLLLSEVALQVGLSILPGCFLGLGLAHLSLRLVRTEAFTFPVVIETSTYAVAIVVALIAFTLSATVVYKLTGNLSLADALKARE